MPLASGRVAAGARGAQQRTHSLLPSSTHGPRPCGGGLRLPAPPCRRMQRLASLATATAATTTVPAVGAGAAGGPLSSVALLDRHYNQSMKAAMGNPYEYHFDRGLYYHEVDRNLICGSQPRNWDDVAQLKNEEGVTAIINLQQDKDLAYWGVKLDNIERACREHNVELHRRPARDFDPHSLRRTIPSAIQALHESLTNNGRVYVHCTAGLGRAPAVCIAYLYWFRNLQLDEAYQHLTGIRPCGPKRDAIRGATYDLLSPNHLDFNGFDRLPKDAFASLTNEEKYVLQYRVLRGAGSGSGQ